MNINIMTDEELAKVFRKLYWEDTTNGGDVGDICDDDIKIAKFIRLCVKDSQPEGLSKEEIRNILYADDTIDPFPPYRCLPPIDKTTANVKAKRIFEAQQALASVEGKDSHVA